MGDYLDRTTAFAEIFYPAIPDKGKPQLQTRIKTVNLTKILKVTNKDPEVISDHELLSVILNHTKGDYSSEREQNDRAHEALIAVRASSIGASKGTTDALSYIGQKMKAKSLEHKVGFLSSFLQRLNFNYDYSLPKGEVTNNKMFLEISKDIKGMGTNSDAGVCRHMHILAVKAATAMGLKMTYGLSYTTSTGYHLNMILTNPENPRETIRFNYGSMTTSRETGSSSLAQENASPSSGTTYHLWGKNDSPIYFTHNEKGRILDQMMGGQSKDLDPNIEERSQIIQTGVNSERTHLRVFHALTPQEEKITGAAYRFSVPLGRFFSADYGIAGYQAKRKVSGNRELEQRGISLRFNHQIKVSLTEKLKLDSDLILRASAFLSTQKNLEKRTQLPFRPLYDADGNWVTRLKLQTKSSTTTALIDLSGQDADVTSGKGLTLYLRRFGVEHTQKLKIGNFNFISETGINVIPLEDVNPAIISQALTASNRNQQLSVRYITPLFPMETPAFIGGSRPRTEFRLQSSFLDGRIESGLNFIMYLPQEFEGETQREKGFYFVGSDPQYISTPTRFYRLIPGEFGGQIYLRLNY